MLAALKRIPTWYGQQPTDRKVQIAALIILAIVLLVEFGLFGATWFSSVQEGLSVHAAADQESLILIQNASADASFSFAMRNAPFCTATCDWSVIDHRDGTLVDRGTQTLASGQQDIIVNISAPPTGRRTAPLQLVVSCSNQETLRCQRATDDATITATTMVREAYPERKLGSAQDLEDALPTWIDEQAELLSELRGIAAIDDPRTTSITQEAAAEADAIERTVQAVRDLTAQERFEAALERIRTQPQPGTPQRYADLVVQERLAAEGVDRIRSSLDRLEAIATLTQDPSELLNALGRLRMQTSRFTTTGPATILNTTTTISLLEQQAQQDLQPTLDTAGRSARQLDTYRAVLCTLYGTNCTSTPTVTNLTETVAFLRAICADPDAWTQERQEARSGFVDVLGTNESVSAAEQRLNVSGRRSAPGWPEREQDILAAARNGTRVTDDPQEILAVLPVPPMTNLTAQYCPVSRPGITPPVSVSPSLPERPNRSIDVEPIALPARMCCMDGACNACEPAEPPILFVHGHSFAERSSPEYSLQAFTDIAMRLQQDRHRLYAGSVFPGQAVQSDSYAGLPDGVSLTTTYYYDSFAEEGAVTFVPRKSERVETYSLRLQEAIERARTATGNDRVVLVTHSMGGLVARRYLQLFGTDRVAGLIMVGTPNHGIPQRTERLCPVVGADLECQDMQPGSVFLRKLNDAPPPGIPVLTIAGTGCDGRAFDGVVDVEDVTLEWADTLIVEGTCQGTTDQLHNAMLDPERHPEVYDAIASFVEDVS